ncbi:MAG: HAD family hydrolase [Firmicutes bacterium]|nr:HAD family hydrolase [Bacillota bacterium]
MNYRGVIFDLDGTLLNTLEDLADSMNLVLRQNGFPQHAIHLYKTFIGDGVINLVRRTLPVESINQAAISQYVAEVRQEYDKRWANKTRPYPQIPELLQELQNQKIRMAVFTNKPDAPAKLMIQHFFPGCPFEIVCGAKPEVPLKPDPTGALAIAKEMNISPEEFLYLGDTGTDMKTAQAAGMYPIGALWGFRTAEELLKNGAKLLLERPEQLLDWLAHPR